MNLSRPLLLLLILLFPIALSCSAASSQVIQDFSGFAALTGIYSDRGVDIDEDGNIEFLNVDVGVHVAHPGEYSLTGYLYDSDNEEVAWSVDHKNFTVGNYTMQLAFDAKVMGQQNLSGPFRLGNLSLTWGSAAVGLISCAWLDDAYHTASYNLSHFTDQYSSDKILSGSGKGDILLTLAIRTSLPATSGRYMYDILGLNVPPISTPFDVIGLDPQKFAHGGYSYGMEGLYIPGKPNNYTVIAHGVKNLNVGLMKLQGDLQRTWVSTQFLADDSGTARAETDLISPRGSYNVKIFGDAAENVTQVDLSLIVVKKLTVDGPFHLAINTKGFPEGNYSLKAQALNGSFRFDELSFGSEEDELQ